MASGGGMGGGHGCKISMLWNWNTINSCFIASSWKINSQGQFAGSCIGVLLLAMSMELLRRSVKEYDRFLITKARRQREEEQQNIQNQGGGSGNMAPPHGKQQQGERGYRPTIGEQAIRALLHTVNFILAYFVMLLAMYYNGYIILCIFLGSFLGSAFFHWEPLGLGSQTTATGDATFCCG
ncbi:putative high affinity copper protein [Podospora australis]|uniref:Copper transport protein n=1 Tax=Podospora australis TaxID=1536484 RepID=A0AAN7ADX6_9PEZI|nr:putative high affinity copper protein [Podospora australis]